MSPKTKIFIAADHAGFALKEQIISHAKKLGVQFEDLGTDSEESVDYPDYADILCRLLIPEADRTTTKNGPFGILICGSGVGISIAANRYSKIRAVLAESELVAGLAREHNHANVLCLGARVVSLDRALKIIRTFLTAEPEWGERHLRRVQKLEKRGKKAI